MGKARRAEIIRPIRPRFRIWSHFWTRLVERIHATVRACQRPTPGILLLPGHASGTQGSGSRDGVKIRVAQGAGPRVRHGADRAARTRPPVYRRYVPDSAHRGYGRTSAARWWCSGMPAPPLGVIGAPSDYHCSGTITPWPQTSSSCPPKDGIDDKERSSNGGSLATGGPVSRQSPSTWPAPRP